MHPRITGLVVWIYGAVSFAAGFITTDLPLIERTIASSAVTLLSVVLILVFRGLGASAARIVLIALAIGLVRGVALVLAVLLFSGSLESSFILRIMSSGLSAVIWIAGVSWVIASLSIYRHRYIELVAQFSADRPSPNLDENPDLDAMKSHLSGATAEQTADPSDEAMRRAAEIVRWEVDNRVRPLSHRLWFSPDAQPPHVRVGALLVDAIKEFPVPVWPVTLLWFVVALVGAPVIFGMQQGIASAAISSLLLALCLVISQAATRRWHTPWLGPTCLALSVVVPIAGAEILVPHVHSAHAGASAFVLFVFVPIALAALIITATAISLAQADREEILQIVQTRWREPEPYASPEVSSYLHNTVQSELTGLALQLERAEVGSVEAREAWERLVAISGRSMETDFQRQRESPQDRVVRLADSWRGIAEVTCEFAVSVSAADPRLVRVTQASAEITSNAVRHGGADRINFSVQPDGGNLTLTARINATLIEPAEPGLGGRWLANFSVTPVEVTPLANETLLSVRF
jgi:hypothetical protein